MTAQGAPSQFGPSQFGPLGPTDPREVAGYQLRARLGAGGMGSVYLSYTRGGQPVALKVVRAELAEDPAFRRRFEHEVRAARRVQGVYTVPVLDSNTEGAAPWLATAYVPGLSLADTIRAYGALPLETVLLLVAGVAEALQSIHSAGIVHRDLKPGNVLLSADGPKVIDFGIARAADTTSLTSTDARVGTPSYMAPEQITGGAVGPAADVFALGIITHHAATGGHPFGEGAPHAVMYRIVQDPPDVAAVPEPLRGLVQACLAKKPAKRPTPAQVIEACRALAPGQTLQRRESWLPSPVEREVTMRLHAEPPTAPPPPPAAPPAPPALPAYPPASAPDGADAPTASTRGGRRTAALLAVTAATAAILGGVLALPLTGDDTPDTTQDPDTTATGRAANPQSEDRDPDDANSGGNTEADQTNRDAPYRLAQSNVDLPIRAPVYREYVGSSIGTCTGAAVTMIYLDDLTPGTGLTHGSFEYYERDADIEYLFCVDDRNGNGGIRFDTDASVGTVDDPGISPEGCYDAARRGATLPNPISVGDLQSGRWLAEDMGLCVETARKDIVLLWIDSVEKDPDNDNMPSYNTTATRWEPNE